MNDRQALPQPARTADTMSEAIALSSPSGRMSMRARAAAQKRLRDELFGPGGLQRPQPAARTPAMIRESAAFLRGLADAGMRPRVHRREAEKLEREADALEVLA